MTDAIDELGALCERMEKSAGRVKAGHKYKRRRWKNGRWQYDYGQGWGSRPGSKEKDADELADEKRSKTWYREAAAARKKLNQKSGKFFVSLDLGRPGQDGYGSATIGFGDSKAAIRQALAPLNLTNRVVIESAEGTYGDPKLFDSTKKTRKSMDNIETPKSAVLSKGLHSFCDYDNKMRKLKKEWLADYVDAFIEEAYEHERMERAHRDPNLMPASNNPAQDIAQAVFNEFMAYCPHNKNLSAAHEHLKVSVDYVESRMRAKNLLHVDSENHETNNKAAVGGYHPTPLALSQDAYAEAEAERNANLQRLGLLKKSEDQVQLAAGDNPINRLAEYEAQRVAAYSAGYGGTAAPARVDPACPFHGRDMMKSGIESRAVHGAVCSCD